jgi:asparagine synthase (glutamine-hydrolysing)
MDIATMAHALEGRSPFLGKELLEFAPGLPDHLKIRGKTTKYLLRKLSERYLPPELPGQPKRGFEVPLKQWMDTELSEMSRDYLTGTAGALYPSLISPSFVKDLLDKKVSVSDERRAKMLYALLCLEIWYRQTAR